MRRSCAACLVVLLPLAALAAERTARPAPPRDLNTPVAMTPPADKAAWEKRRQELREQMLVATGLWPMPERPPIRAVIHGKIDRDGYTVEKVFFASYPGHDVCGNLYRPKGKPGKHAGVLCPHGHWMNGRFTDSGEQAAADMIRLGGEQTYMGARYPLQARCAQLARMGCVVFHYDMVGVADSQQIAHTAGFTDVAAELRLQSFMGLQTFNSIRALDFLAGLPDVDPARIGVTGASGGGTQTFMLCALDDRPAAAFPAVMVSTTMQGGCVCENCSYLRQGTGNVEITALIAPRPVGMTGAHDWTEFIETRGLPDLKAVYRLYGAEDKVMARVFPQYPHNYNQTSREVMYHWFNKHLGLGLPEPVKEQPFEPVPSVYGTTRHELSVFDAQHPLPKDAAGAAGLRKTMAAMSDRQMAALRPTDAGRLKEFRRVVGTALRVMIHDRLPGADDIKVVADGAEETVARFQYLALGRKAGPADVPAVFVSGANPNGTVVVWIHPAGKASLLHEGKLVPAAKRIIDGGASILAPDVFLTGERAGPAPEVNKRYAGFTFCYNRPLVAERVHDILTAVAAARSQPQTKAVSLVGFDKAGPWVILARALAGDAVARTAADVGRFRFDRIEDLSDEMLLPGAVKYGGLPAFAALCAPGELYLHDDESSGVATFAAEAYRAAGASDRLHTTAGAERMAGWLLR